MHTQHSNLSLRPSSSPSKARDGVFQEFNQISNAPQVFTDAPIAEAIRKSYPELHLTISSISDCDFLGYAAGGEATAISVESEYGATANLVWKQYYPPARRMDGALVVWQIMYSLGNTYTLGRTRSSISILAKEPKQGIRSRTIVDWVRPRKLQSHVCWPPVSIQMICTKRSGSLIKGDRRRIRTCGGAWSTHHEKTSS